VELAEGIVLGSLAGFSVYDMKYKKIPVAGLVVFGVVVLIYCLCIGTGLYSMLSGLVPGAVVLLVSLCTKESIGTGDGLMLLVLGMFCGFRTILSVLGTALVFTAFTAMLLLIFRRAGRKTELPFLPFLFAGYVLTLVW